MSTSSDDPWDTVVKPFIDQGDAAGIIREIQNCKILIEEAANQHSRDQLRAMLAVLEYGLTMERARARKRSGPR